MREEPYVEDRQGLSNGLILSKSHRFEIAIAARQFFGSTRAASILSSRPPILAAAVRRGSQGWPRLPRPPEGSSLDWPGAQRQPG